MDKQQMILSIINIIAVLAAPIVSVAIGQYLQNRALKRKDKMELFKTLMMCRSGWTPESVRALNIIDVVFSGRRKKDTDVREAWKKYYDSLCVDDPGENAQNSIINAQYALLEAMAVSLGYKDKITWKTIQNPYYPKWMAEEAKKEARFKDMQLTIGQAAINAFGQNAMPQQNQNVQSNTADK